MSGHWAIRVAFNGEVRTAQRLEVKGGPCEYMEEEPSRQREQPVQSLELGMCPLCLRNCREANLAAVREQERSRR